MLLITVLNEAVDVGGFGKTIGTKLMTSLLQAAFSRRLNQRGTMKSAEIESTILSVRQELAALRVKLDVLIQRFQSELPSAAETWIRGEVERRIDSHADTVALMSVEKLKFLKLQVNTLIASLPDVTKRETSDKSAYPHNNASGGAAIRHDGFFAASYRNVVSHLGAILDGSGLLTEPNGYSPSWEKTTGGKFRYSIGMGSEKLLTPVLSEYQKVYKEFQTLSKDIEERQKEFAKAKAKELWESA